jgi:alpha-glucosidase
MFKKAIFTVIAISCACTLYAQPYTSKISVLPGKKWWGAFVARGADMPYSKPTGMIDLSKQGFNNQGVPLLLSNKGRYIWSNETLKFEVNPDAIRIESAFEEIKVVHPGETLRNAYLAACKKHFPPSGVLPDPLFFSMPQYNTWIELMYDQNQEDILNYADNIIKYDFPEGVFMIDDNWQKYYGTFDFKPDKFPDPEAMIERRENITVNAGVERLPYFEKVN